MDWRVVEVFAVVLAFVAVDRAVDTVVSGVAQMIAAVAPTRRRIATW